MVDDWSLDFVGQEIRHVDGVLSYDGNTGTAPALDDYVIGGTSGAVGRVIAGSDLGGVSATGTLTLTSVRGRFANNETLRVLSEVPFDTVGGTPQGFVIGDTITGPTTESIDVQAIEYNEGPKVTLAGEGSIYGDNLTTGFANNEQLDVSGGATAVALVNGAESNNSALFATCLVNGALEPPGTVNLNESVLLHYDAGTIDIPEDAKVSDATTGGEGFVQQKEGVTATGSLRIIDYDSTGGAFTDNNTLDIEDMVFYNAQVAGEVFLPGDQIEGQTSTERFRVLAVIDDGDSTGKLITAGRSAGAMTLNEDIHRILPGDILGPKIAQVENLTTILAAATINIPGGLRLEQRSAGGVDQGGILNILTSLNIRRSSNAFLSFIKETFSQIAQLDDKPAIDGNVRDALYTVLTANGWEMPDLSFRFLEKGAWRDSGLNNLYTNYNSRAGLFTSKDITDNGFLYTATNPTPMPNAYLAQNRLTGAEVLAQFWLEGPFDVIEKVKSITDVRTIDAATPALGQNIATSTGVTWFTREWGLLYFQRDNAQQAAVAPVPLDAQDDASNKTGQFRNAFTVGGAGAFTVGEEIIGTTSGAIGVVMASDSGATGNVDYALKTSAQFGTSETITGQVSAKTATSAAGGSTNLVAGYDTDIRTMVVDRRFTGGTTTVATFIIGEQVSQAVSLYDGFVLEDDGGTIYVQDAPGTAAPNGTGQLSGDTSGALNTPSAVADFTTVPKDIGDGAGDQNYSGVTGADRTGGSPQPVLNVYEWDKYVTRKEADSTQLLQGGRGTIAPIEGRLYRGFDPTFAEVLAAPYGSMPSPTGSMFGAQGHFIDNLTLVAADLQKVQLIDNAGLTRNPPNIQTAQISNLQSGWAAAMYRSTGVGLTAILRGEFTVGVIGSGNNQSADSTILVAAGTRTISPLPSDVPNTGVLRIEDPNLPGNFLSFPYNLVNRATNIFTLTSGTIGAVTSSTDLVLADDVGVALIEEVSAGATVTNQVQFVATINVVTVARKKGFDDFEAAGQFIATGLNQGVVRTPDGVVNLP
jgi:hypothetical protein